MDLLDAQVSDLRSFLRQPELVGDVPSQVAPGATAAAASSSASAAATSPHRTQQQPRDGSGPDRSPPTDAASPGGEGRTPQPAGAKRRAEDEEHGPKQQRTKRNRYISLACNECKRRKIKCDGESPCQRCGKLNLACLYAPNCCSNNFKDSDEYRRMSDQLAGLQDQVNSLFEALNALRQEPLRLAPIEERGAGVVMGGPLAGGGGEGGTGGMPTAPNGNIAQSPSTTSTSNSLQRPPDLPPFSSGSQSSSAYRGPTSIAFTVDVAKKTLHNMGYSGDGNDGNDENGGSGGGGEPRDEGPAAATSSAFGMSPPSMASQLLPHQPPFARPPAPDPLWQYDKDEMLRLCRVHEDEVGIMYPVVNIEQVMDHARALATWMESVRRQHGVGMQHHHHSYVEGHGFVSGGAISDVKTLELKIVMCCALVVEEHGHSPKADELLESIRPVIDRKLSSDPSDVADLPFLALLGGYRFLSNDEILAWRVIGQVARHCLELGLHRREGMRKIADGQARRNAINSFWTAYVLDRRWSFATGLPYVVHDDKIDPTLPYPDEHPYLVAMITYSKLGAKVWRLVDYFEPAVILELKREDFEALDQEILEWYDSVPEDVKIGNLRELPLPSTPSYNLQRLQIWTRLRLNQIRIWLHTPVLHSASSIQMNMHLARKAVDLARETIQYLKRLNDSTNLYRRMQVFYHQFLTSAIAVLFLASTHAPVDFSPIARPEFYTALELIRDMSTKSWVSQRLWRTVRSLKRYAPRLGLQEEGQEGGGEDGPDGHHHHHRHYTPQLPDPRSVALLAGVAAPAMQPPLDVPFPPPPPPPHSSSSPGSIWPRSAYPLSGLDGRPSPAPYTRGHVRRASSVVSAQDGPAATPGSRDKQNGVALQNEMSRIFEGYLGLGGLPPASSSAAAATAPDFSPADGAVGGPTEDGTGLGVSSAAEEAASDPLLVGGIDADFGVGDGDASVYQHFKDLF